MSRLCPACVVSGSALSPRPVHRRVTPSFGWFRVSIAVNGAALCPGDRSSDLPQIVPVGALAEINTITARASFLRSPLQTPQTGEKNAMPRDETGTLDAHKLRELAAWYREFAERAEPSVREARLRIAEQLERDADLLEGKR